MIVTLEEAQQRLPELIAELPPGEEMRIQRDGVVIAMLVRNDQDRQPRKAGSAANTPHWMSPDFDAPMEEFRESTDNPLPQFGSCKGMLTIISDDDEHLKDFAEYMP